jgi:hypothetical protein
MPDALSTTALLYSNTTSLSSSSPSNSVDAPRTLQEFEVATSIGHEPTPKFPSVTLVVDSNWGFPYSCLYCFRAHGVDEQNNIILEEDYDGDVDDNGVEGEYLEEDYDGDVIKNDVEHEYLEEDYDGDFDDSDVVGEYDGDMQFSVNWKHIILAE